MKHVELVCTWGTCYDFYGFCQNLNMESGEGQKCVIMRCPSLFICLTLFLSPVFINPQVAKWTHFNGSCGKGTKRKRAGPKVNFKEVRAHQAHLNWSSSLSQSLPSLPNSGICSTSLRIRKSLWFCLIMPNQVFRLPLESARSFVCSLLWNRAIRF